MQKLKAGVFIELAGDHHIHGIEIGAYGKDIDITYDEDSITYTLHLTENDAKELYWELLELIPKLRYDRR